MSEEMEYCGIVKHENEVLYSREDDSFNKLMISLLCTIENDYHSAKGQIFKKTTGEIIYQCQRAAIC